MDFKPTMTCEKCKDIIDQKDAPHTVRTCEGCGRKMYVRELVKHGRGIQIREGDDFVIPANWLTLSANPLKGNANFTRAGLQWFAELIFLENLPNKYDGFLAELTRLKKIANDTLSNSNLLKGLDIENPDHTEEIIKKLETSKETTEWWSFLSGVYLSVVDDAISENNIQQAIWAMTCAERCRAMVTYKNHLEEVIWMGHSARRLLNLLRVWDSNKTNSDEEFWQQTFTENSYALSQVFSVPAVFIEGKAYVGGMNIERKDAKFVDYLFSSEFSREALIIEIKTPVTKLLGSRYRGIHKPSAELSGAVIQTQDYRRELSRSFQEIVPGNHYKLSFFNPKCILIVGNGEVQLTDDDKKRHSFELFRTGLKDIEIVTYDELFRKIEVLATLFNLIRK